MKLITHRLPLIIEWFTFYAMYYMNKLFFLANSLVIFDYDVDNITFLMKYVLYLYVYMFYLLLGCGAVGLRLYDGLQFCDFVDDKLR